MAVCVEQVMRSVNHFFDRACYQGTFTITGGRIALPLDLPDNAWIAISGSMFHDGVHEMHSDHALPAPDEAFTGKVYILHPPQAFLELCRQIDAYDEKTPAGALQSESFGNYSYTRASGANGVKTWQEAFAAQLRPYRRMFTEVDV